MDGPGTQRLERLLEEIRDGQRTQLERQAESLALQREQHAILQRQAERSERIQDRAEQLQAKSAALVGGARRATAVILPVIVVLIGIVAWLMLRFLR
jgi:hypothetical protein